MPPNNFFLGHLTTVLHVRSRFPKDAYKNYFFGAIATSFDADAAYLDLWPFSDPLLIVANAEMAEQATSNTTVAFEKPEALRIWLRPIAGGITMFDGSSEVWKPLRAMFNAGFTSNYVWSLVPAIVREVNVYRKILRQRAQEKEMFFMDPVTLRFMIDVTGNTIMGTELNSQQKASTLADSFFDLIKNNITDQEVNPLQWINAIRIAKVWLCGRRLNKLLGAELDKRFEQIQSNKIPSPGSQNSIMDLILRSYLSEDSPTGALSVEERYRAFRTDAIHHLRMFLFVGHDSTGSTICYIYYLLAKHPATLAKLRAEHDEVFGKDVSSVGEQILANPRIVNQLSYTQAVIKEAMRLFPAAGCVRDGRPGVELVDKQGRSYPTENCIVFIPHYFIHRSAKYWPYPDEFRPERWLVDPEHELYPRVKGAWRPFEHGPRQCIGQALVMTEIKTLLAMIIREFDIQPAYEEFDRLHPSKGYKTIFGERAYLKDAGAAHPADHLPCRVKLRSD